MRILAFETSCDETSAAIVEDAPAGDVRLLAHVVYSQIDLHQQYGGVYPEAASREHIRKIGLVFEETLRQGIQSLNPKSQIPNPKQIQKNSKQRKIFEFGVSDFRFPDLQTYLKSEIDAIAVTAGPGLIGSLLVGVNTAKTLAYSFNKPLIAVNHHEGHIMATFIKASQIPSTKSQIPNNDEDFIPKLPAIALVVSGGHTKLIYIKDFADLEEIGATKDDAAGEAYDKVARLLGLPYPGGPQIDRLAAAYAAISYKLQAKSSIKLPRPMIDSGDLDFSFSGLKTAVATVVAKQSELTEEFIGALSFEFQAAVIDVLASKTMQAIGQYAPKSLIVAGGVAMSQRLREEIATRTTSQFPAITLHIPPPSLCTDNAAMIGAAAVYRALGNRFDNWYDVVANDHFSLPKATGMTNDQ